MIEDKGFLSRWSDRKLKNETDVSSAVEADSNEEILGEDEFEGKSDDEILSILELPDPEKLKLGDTVEKFMDGRVPERIRARALRAFGKQTLYSRISMGLMSIATFLDAATVIENLQTIYEVGKGYAEQALDALESLADDDTSTDDELGSEIVAQVDTRLEHEEPVELEETPVESDVADKEATPQNHSLLLNNDIPEEVVTIAPRPRRMRFDETSNSDSLMQITQIFKFFKLNFFF